MTASRWRSERLKHVADVAFSSVDKKSVDGEVAVRLCNYTDVYYGDEITADVPFMEATASLDQVRRFGLQAGDVLITKDSETADDIGSAAFVPETLDDVVCGYHLAVLRPKLHRVDAKYLFWTMASAYAREQMTVLASGVTRYGLRFGDVGNLHLQVPTLDRQVAVARFLDRETARIDELIADKQRQAALLEERLARQVERLLLPGLDDRRRVLPTDVPLPSEYPNSWTFTALGHVLRRITYGFTNPMPVVDDGPYMLTANDIKDGFIDFEAARRTSAEAFERLLTDKSRPNKGDVLLTKDGSLGRVALFPGDRACINQSVALLRPNVDLVEPGFLAEVLRARPYQDAMLFEAGGTTIRHLYITRMARLRIALPPKEHQGRLLGDVRRLRDEARRRTEALEQSSRLLRERRQVLITAAVTGQIAIASEVA